VEWVLIAALAAPSMLAQNGYSFLNAAESKVPYTDASARPEGSCAALVSLTNYEFSITSAQLVPTSAEAPEHCRVSGVIPPEIRFEVNLPAAWNRRLYMHGNGGYAGTPPEDPGRIRTKGAAMRNGFATAYTDTGHDRRAYPLGEFAYNNTQKEIDYSFRAVHLTIVTAKKLVAAYYSRPASYSYWDGCSTGGRQGLMSAQRFPEDFDGIVAGAPVLNFSSTMMGYIWKLNALKHAPLTLAKVELVGAKVYERCDARDGLKDGLIEDPRNCDFDPAKHLRRCESGRGENCFTAGEIRALAGIYSDVKSNGQTIFPGQPVSAEAAPPNGASGWNRWIISEDGPSIGKTFSETFLRYLAFPEDNPDRTWESFDFDKDPERMEFIHSILDATNPDLSEFRNRGGKMITYYGWADTALNPMMNIEYYEQVREKLGDDAKDVYRLYMVPGMFHCRNGLGVDRIDAMTPLINWVERGVAPGAIIASREEDGKVKMTRPLCVYPEVAKYKGTGDPSDAGSFICEAPLE
jgi:feruloyl esterase